MIGRLENVEPMPMLCELTTVLQYIVAIAESMALPPSSITFLRHGTLKISSKICSGWLQLIFIGAESDHWLCLSVTHSLTHSLTNSVTLSKLD